MRKLLAPLAVLALLSSPAAARDGTVTGIIMTLDEYLADDGTNIKYQMVGLKTLRVPWVLSYLMDSESKLLVPRLEVGMKVTIVFYELTADFVVREIAAAD